LSLAGSAGHSRRVLTIIDPGLRGCGLCGWGLGGWAVAHPIILPIVSHASRGRFPNRIAALTIVGGSF